MSIFSYFTLLELEVAFPIFEKYNDKSKTIFSQLSKLRNIIINTSLTNFD